MTHIEGPDEAERRFGAHVRQARETREWTQERLRHYLAEASGIELSQTAMTRLEQGKRPIRFNEAVALARLLGLGLGTYVQEVRLESDEEYRAALRRLDGLRAQRAAAMTNLETLRTKFQEQEVRHQDEVRSLSEEIGRVAMALLDYENGDDVTGGLVVDLDAEIEEGRAELRQSVREAARRAGAAPDGE